MTDSMALSDVNDVVSSADGGEGVRLDRVTGPRSLSLLRTTATLDQLVTFGETGGLVAALVWTGIADLEIPLYLGDLMDLGVPIILSLLGLADLGDLPLEDRTVCGDLAVDDLGLSESSDI